MTASMLHWGAALLTVAALAGYELWLALLQRRQPHRLARAAHAGLREQWFAAVSAQRGSEVLAVQTLRNSLMSATMIASTAALALMGTVTLAAPSLQATFAGGALQLTPRLAMELALLALLFASLISAVMAARFYNHASFIGGMPVESDARREWAAAGVSYLRRAGLLYSWSLRHLVLVAPVVAFILHPLAGPLAALLVIGTLARFDRMPVSSSSSSSTASNTE